MPKLLTLVLAGSLALAACQPMYGSKPQKLRTPEPIRPPQELAADPTVPKVLESCEVYTKEVKVVRRDTPRAEALTREGDAKVAEFERASEPRRKGELIVDGIEEYLRALDKDPFNAHATLKLALAYDKVLRKGCALALLSRLNRLAQHPTYAPAATAEIDAITEPQNKSWFSGYRRDALSAVGR
ncbi:MAG: hypothetical protein H0T89_20110 [Deltaproteobacteria bacterium]|nr:hypothetical protein [Deltaproteobacteria bacterium]MDQ3296381.1 hypothetical protein [Myxococcota bacterium]